MPKLSLQASQTSLPKFTSDFNERGTQLPATFVWPEPPVKALMQSLAFLIFPLSLLSWFLQAAFPGSIVFSIVIGVKE